VNQNGEKVRRHDIDRKDVPSILHGGVVDHGVDRSELVHPTETISVCPLWIDEV
jgi:hypothetical protein